MLIKSSTSAIFRSKGWRPKYRPERCRRFLGKIYTGWDGSVRQGGGEITIMSSWDNKRKKIYPTPTPPPPGLGWQKSIRPLSLYLHCKQTNLQNYCMISEKGLEDGELSFLKLSRPSPAFSMIKTQTLTSDDGLRRSSGAHSKEKKREISASIRLVSNLSVLFPGGNSVQQILVERWQEKKPGVFCFSWGTSHRSDLCSRNKRRHRLQWRHFH